MIFLPISWFVLDFWPQPLFASGADRSFAQAGTFSFMCPSSIAFYRYIDQLSGNGNLTADGAEGEDRAPNYDGLTDSQWHRGSVRVLYPNRQMLKFAINYAVIWSARTASTKPFRILRAALSVTAN